MQFKVILLCAIVGLAMAQRGHYAGVNRPINGDRYQGGNTGTANNNNLAAPSQGFLDNRFSGSDYPTYNPTNYPTYYYSQQPFNLGSGLVSPYQGYNGNFYQQPQFPFAPYNGFNGRR